MNEEFYEGLLSRSLDENLLPQEQQRLDEALARNPKLRELREDLLKIQDLAREPVPPARPALATELSEKVIRLFPRKVSNSTRIRPFLVPLAAAAMLLLVIGSSIWWFQGEPKRSELSEAVATREFKRIIHEMELNYHQTVAKWEADVLMRISQMPAPLAFVFSERLLLVNREISRIERIAEQYPETSKIVTSLAHAYEFKAYLLHQILES